MNEVALKLLNYIFGAMMIISVISAVATGRMDQLSLSIINGATSSIELVISLMGVMCFFTGLLKIADEGGLTKIIAKLLSPFISKLFPDYEKNSNAFKAICMNITANLLGLGNAATPFGIKAMQEMEKNNKTPLEANKSMIMFVILNTASIQLVPTMLSAIRQKHGALNPFDVLPAIWVTSIFALSIGIMTAKVFEKRS